MSSENLDIVFNESCINTFEKYQQISCTDLEQGGIIVGEFYNHLNKIAITDAILSKKAHNTRYGVDINTQEMNECLDNVRKRSNFTKYIVGTWHTHPEKTPTPSNIDLQTWEEFMQKANIRVNCQTFVIVGNNIDIKKSIWHKTYFKDETTLCEISCSLLKESTKHKNV